MSDIEPEPDGSICRICLSNESLDSSAPESGGQLLTACNCSGTNGYMHESCLRECIASRFDDRCEICGAKYNVTVKWRMLGFGRALAAALRQQPKQLAIRLVIFVVFSAVFALQVAVIITSRQFRGWAQYTVTCLNCAVSLTALAECVNLVNSYRRSKVDVVLGLPDNSRPTPDPEPGRIC